MLIQGVHSNMTTPKDHEGSLIYRLFTSVFLFGLLLEWIIPWTGKLAGSGQNPAAVLYVFLAVIVAIGLLRLPALIELMLHGVNCFLTLAMLFKEEQAALGSTLLQLPALLGEHVVSLFENGLMTMSGELRTLLLLVGFAMLIPALQRLIWLRQIGLGLAGLTLLYLIVLHVSLGYDTFYGMLRAAVSSLLLVSIAALPRLERLLATDSINGFEQQWQSHLLGIQPYQSKTWNMRAVLIAATVSLCLLLVSAPQEQRHDPPQWTAAISKHFEQMLESAAKPQASKVSSVSLSMQTGKALSGYSFDDSLLGAPF